MGIVENLAIPVPLSIRFLVDSHPVKNSTKLALVAVTL